MPYSHRSRPRVIGLTVVRNEQDIIEPMVRHNAGLLDVLILLDNGSVDATRAIALALARELGNVVVTDSAKFGHTQSKRMSRLLNAAQSAYFADFIVFLDADEFIGATSRTAFHTALAKVPPGGYGEMAWCNYVLPDGISAEDPPLSMGHRLAATTPVITKIVLRLDGRFHPGLVVEPGSHLVTRSGQVLPSVILPDLPVWHYPVRGCAQLSAKALVGWIACLAANPRVGETLLARHWHHMYRRIVDGPGLQPADLRALSLHYGDSSLVLGLPQPPDPLVVHDPAPIDYVRRHSTGASLDPLVLLARSWEQTLREVDPLFRPGEVPDAVIDIPPFRFLHEKHRFSSVLDIVCGVGQDLELFSRLGVQDLAGVGPLPPEAMMLSRGGYVQHDPAAGFSLGRRYALVLCLHAATDQAPRDALILAANADRHAQAMIAFSLDDPSAEQLGRWLGRWFGLGWVPDLPETLALRCLSSDAALRRGLVILRRAAGPVTDPGTGQVADPGGGSGNAEEPDATAELLAIAGLPFRMPAPTAGLHEEPLRDAAEASWLGYPA